MAASDEHLRTASGKRVAVDSLALGRVKNEKVLILV